MRPLGLIEQMLESLVKEFNRRVKGTEKLWNDPTGGEAIVQGIQNISSVRLDLQWIVAAATADRRGQSPPANKSIVWSRRRQGGEWTVKKAGSGWRLLRKSGPWGGIFPIMESR